MSNFVNLMDVIYPVGSIYQSMSATSPASTIGGTWTKIKTFLYGADTANQTGGEATHTLTIDEMPKHNHRTINDDCVFNSNSAPNRITVATGTTAAFGLSHFIVTNSGGGATTQQLAALHNLFHLVSHGIAALKASGLNLSEVAYA